MCIACREFIKNKLTFREFQSALWEVAREDEEHIDEIEQALRQTSNDPEKLRKKLEDLQK